MLWHKNQLLLNVNLSVSSLGHVSEPSGSAYWYPIPLMGARDFSFLITPVSLVISGPTTQEPISAMIQTPWPTSHRHNIKLTIVENVVIPVCLLVHRPQLGALGLVHPVLAHHLRILLSCWSIRRDGDDVREDWSVNVNYNNIYIQSHITRHTSHITGNTSHITHPKSHTADVESVSVRPDMILSVVPTRDFDIGVSSSDNPEDSLISLFEK